MSDSQERRKSLLDRRSKERQGKYDRRRNRCGRCRHFEIRGHCRKHDIAVTEETFACILFESAD